MKNSHIDWTDHTWNPVTGCTQVSPGCDNCYALAIAEPRRGLPSFPQGFDVTLRPHKLRDPLKWKAPGMIFVNSMSDLFHKDIPPEYVGQIWQTMMAATHHVFQVLTKRPHRAAQLIDRMGLPLPPHIWLGVSAENQQLADNRITALLQIPSAVPWVSAEPLLGPLDLTPFLDRLKWVVDGGESGNGRRPADPDWFRSLRDQCQEYGVSFFHKQGNHRYPGRDRELDGRTWDEYPDVSRIQLAHPSPTPSRFVFSRPVCYTRLV